METKTTLFYQSSSIFSSTRFVNENLYEGKIYSPVLARETTYVTRLYMYQTLLLDLL